MKTKAIFKRGLFLGIVWCAGSLGYFAAPETPKILFLLTLALGIAECVCSIDGRLRSTRVLPVLLAIQGAYYLACVGYVIALPEDMTIKIFAVLIAACMVLLIGFSLAALRKEKQSAA